MALVFAMAGGAAAASHYLITSSKQISPKVLKELKTPGAKGATGAAGPAGPTGRPEQTARMGHRGLKENRVPGNPAGRRTRRQRGHRTRARRDARATGCPGRPGRKGQHEPPRRDLQQDDRGRRRRRRTPESRGARNRRPLHDHRPLLPRSSQHRRPDLHRNQRSGSGVRRNRRCRREGKKPENPCRSAKFRAKRHCGTRSRFLRTERRAVRRPSKSGAIALNGAPNNAVFLGNKAATACYFTGTVTEEK